MVTDSLCASLGEELHVHKAIRLGGRGKISGEDTVASIKPGLHVDEEGQLVVNGKVRGRKKSLNALVNYMGEKWDSGEQENRDDYVFISRRRRPGGHGRCPRPNSGAFRHETFPDS